MPNIFLKLGFLHHELSNTKYSFQDELESLNSKIEEVLDNVGITIQEKLMETNSSKNYSIKFYKTNFTKRIFGSWVKSEVVFWICKKAFLLFLAQARTILNPAETIITLN